MPLHFKSQTEHTAESSGSKRPLWSIYLNGLSLLLASAGFCMAFYLCLGLHPSKPVEVLCNPGMENLLDESAKNLEKIRVNILQYKVKDVKG